MFDPASAGPVYLYGAQTWPAQCFRKMTSAISRHSDGYESVMFLSTIDEFQYVVVDQAPVWFGECEHAVIKYMGILTYIRNQH